LSSDNCPHPPTENYWHSHMHNHPYHCYHQCPATMHHFLAKWNQYHCIHLCSKIHYH
jgi:hypothetical protein